MTAAQTIFWIALIGLAYPYAFYPLILGAVRRVVRLKRRSAWRGPMSDEQLPTVSIIIPVHNEEKVLEEKLRNTLALDYPASKREILIAFDGCTDQSVRIAMQFAAAGVRTISSDVRRGKIFAMNLAARHAAGSILLFTDARAMIERGALRTLVTRFSEPEVGAVSGAIAVEKADDERMGPTLRVYRRLENWIRSAESDIGSSIGATGALYAVRAILYQRVPEDTILDDLVVPLRLLGRDYRTVFEVRSVCTLRASAASEFARKRRTLAGNYQALWRERGMMNPLSSRFWWQVLSHKAARLAAPFFLIVFWVSSLLADGSLYDAAVAGQSAFYATAILGLGVGKASGRLARLQVPYSLCVLQAANLCGLLTFSFGRLDVRWKKN